MFTTQYPFTSVRLEEGDAIIKDLGLNWNYTCFLCVIHLLELLLLKQICIVCYTFADRNLQCDLSLIPHLTLPTKRIV